MNIIYKEDKIVLMDDDFEIGELCYKIDSYGIVLIGTYIDAQYRGKGYFKILLQSLMNKHQNTVIYICCIKDFIFPTIEKMGFERIDEPVPFWGIVSNGINFKYTP